MGDGRADSAALLQLIQQQAKEAQVWDFSALAQAQGTMVSAVMLGVVAGSGLFPFARAHFEASIQDGSASAAQTQASLKGFTAGFERAANAQALQAMLHDDDSAPTTATLRDLPTSRSASPAAVQALPAAVREFAHLGYQRLLDYQGTAYANLYVARLQTVLNAEIAADPAQVQGHAASRHEVAGDGRDLRRRPFASDVDRRNARSQHGGQRVRQQRCERRGTQSGRDDVSRGASLESSSRVVSSSGRSIEQHCGHARAGIALGAGSSSGRATEQARGCGRRSR
jgi:hypothetical protein